MSVIACSNGHYYDDNKFNCCPICGEVHMSIEKKNKYVFSAGNGVDLKETLTERYDENKATEDDLTISVNLKNKKNTLTTGWLVCVSGESIGKSFPIKTERNFIGRDYDMDIVIPDKCVSRKNHCSIIYDSKTYEFYFMHGNSPVMINKKFVETSIKLEENDLLNFGESEYIFIPYCKKGREWND